MTEISLVAGRLSMASAATFVVLLAALHLIKPRLDPSWHFISEYAIGDHGWIMVLAFRQAIRVGGAREHNLEDVSLSIPKGVLTLNACSQNSMAADAPSTIT